MDEMGKKVVHKSDNLFYEISLFENDAFKVIRGFHRTGLRQFKV